MTARWVFAALAAAALSTSVLAAILGAADLAADEARGTLERWRDTGRTGDSAEWDAVVARLELARHLEPRDATHRAAIAELISWRLLAALPDEPFRHELIGSARAEQLAALAARPSWAMAWARLAEIDYLAGRPASVLMPLLRRAAALGPYEPGVQLVLARVGIGLWHDLGAREQATVELAVTRSLAAQSNHAGLAALALHHGRIDWLIGLAPGERYKRDLLAIQARAAR